MRRFYMPVAAAWIGLGLAAPAQAQQYTVTDLSMSGVTYALSTGASGMSQVGYGYVPITGFVHALLWNGTAASQVDLNGNLSQSQALGTSGTTQVGFGNGLSTNSSNHAFLWSSTAASAIDLNGSLIQSRAYGASGTTQVGYGQGTSYSNYFHAYLWSGTAASGVDLNPTGFNDSHARAVSGATQVGDVTVRPGYIHAYLWHGTAASAVNLNGSLIQSQAYGASDTTQVGWGSGPTTGSHAHALLWSGTAVSAVDLHPAGFDNSQARAVSGATQVGFASGPSTGYNDSLATDNDHAFLWNSTAASAVDLNAFLPNGFNTYSHANGVDSSGNIVGYGTGTSGTHVFLWTPAPEPSPSIVLAIGLLGIGVLAFKAKKRRA